MLSSVARHLLSVRTTTPPVTCKEFLLRSGLSVPSPWTCSSSSRSSSSTLASTTPTAPVSALQLTKHKIIVTRITAIEELAGATILCSDKTGTLATNKLTGDKNLGRTYGPSRPKTPLSSRPTLPVPGTRTLSINALLPSSGIILAPVPES
jgi:hypothetical protein